MLTEYMEVFLEELQEQLELMDGCILHLERSGSSDEAIQSLFRAAHTVKGSSAAMGFEDMKSVTHEMEHILDLVRNRKLDVTIPMIDLLFQSLDCLKRLKQDIESGTQTPTDVTHWMEALRSFDGSSAAANAQSSGAAVMNTALPVLNMEQCSRMNEARHSGLNVWWVQVWLSPECTIPGARGYVIQAKLSECGEVWTTVPELEQMEENVQDSVHITYLYAGPCQAQELQELVAELTEVAGVKISVPAAPVESSSSSSDDQVCEDRGGSSARSKSSTIRVNVERLEQLMNLVGELVIEQARIHEVARTIRKQLTSEAVDDMGQIADHLTRIIGELQESVMKARMLPIEQLFTRFPRMVRDLSRDLGKEIDLVLEGQDTELDRTIIEEIADPLIHLIRNAIDHGIEQPLIREQAGKRRKGILRVRAAHEDNQVIIRVEDDGAGIDPAKMIRSALNKGVLSKEEAEQLSDREAIELIFRPGFSTANQVSDVSGRGVGMDIVRSHIQKLNGLIDIGTKLGEGTCFSIKLPLTLAIISGLMVKLQEHKFIIPMSHIAEIVRVPADQVRTIQGHETILLRDRAIPVTWIHDLLHIPRMEKKRQISLVIVGSAEKRMALAVDELLGNQDIVIKTLGDYVGNVSSIAGATILGDGKVALILNVTGILNRTL